MVCEDGSNVESDGLGREGLEDWSGKTALSCADGFGGTVAEGQGMVRLGRLRRALSDELCSCAASQPQEVMSSRLKRPDDAAPVDTC